jgi:serine/threonine protein kinase
MFPGENVGEQIQKIVEYTGYPSDDQLNGLKSNVGKEMVRGAKLPNYPPNQKETLKDIPPIFATLIQKMTAFSPQERITVDEILASEAVQLLRRKEEEVECEKTITTMISDNKKLSVDEYRKIIYGLKKSTSCFGN